ncbi:bifunctional acetate--CoA ligase family protein/GNAT family N-acetyltransferase [Methylohalobius crimeensis]|uniref:bifunctional acetate--CoA ligase family protein/GNAT family N-acetyltransferase n=1 Tax=Methylohalobius crimeensis TaxID=244365 RepID=UPI0003B77BA8|nr:bifunctional acetate--CoA ligase family protein/GNAT family N-acetyltransferase [Methylohalobius crimeensis]
MGAHYLDHMFHPRSVAVFGASERPDSVGARVFANLLAGGFSGSVYPVNPKHEKVQGQRCYRDISQIGAAVDLAVIATPARTVPGILQSCGTSGVCAAIVLSAGFEGAEGEGLRARLQEAARPYGMRVLGPNCLGLIRPGLGLNATFSQGSALPGDLALVSQSGALCTAILDWAAAREIGFSTVVSLGDAVDTDFGDLLDYLALDTETRGILLYVEGVNHARDFMSGLRAAARVKPVIVVKAGRQGAGSRAAQSHTGALVGADDVFDAALRRAGVVRAHTIEQLFAAAQLLASHHRIHGQRLAIVTNGGGPAVMAVDRAADVGLQLAELSPDTLAALDQLLPAHWPRANPVDILGDAGADRYREAVRLCLADPGIDGLLVMLTPQAMTDPPACAEAVAEATADQKKPVLACWMGEAHMKTARERLTDRHIPNFTFPEAAVEAFAYLASYQQNQQLLKQVPAPLVARSTPDISGARLIIESALAERRSELSGNEAKAILRAFDIPTNLAVAAHSPGEALVVAESIGFPVAMKIDSPDISHKSDVNGVRLHIDSAEAVRRTYQELVGSVARQRPGIRIHGVTIEAMYDKPHGRELLVGVLRDPAFGPIVTFGAGGTAVEVLRDRAVALPPLNRFVARDLIRQTRIYTLLQAFRHLPAANLDALEQVLLRVSEIVCELPEIREMDINPLIVDEHGALAVDARMAVAYHAPGPNRYGHMAVHPYPAHLVKQVQLSDGTDITLRPIRPEDAEIEQAFVRGLSAQTKYFRFMQSIKELSHEELIRLTQLDYHRGLALIATVREAGAEVEIGVARYAMNPDGESCEFALVVGDAWQRRGIGSRLMQALMEAARAQGFRRMEGEVLASNQPMLELVRKLGFRVRGSPDDPTVMQVNRLL